MGHFFLSVQNQFYQLKQFVGKSYINGNGKKQCSKRKQITKHIPYKMKYVVHLVRSVRAKKVWTIINNCCWLASRVWNKYHYKYVYYNFLFLYHGMWKTQFVSYFRKQSPASSRFLLPLQQLLLQIPEAKLWYTWPILHCGMGT